MVLIRQNKLEEGRKLAHDAFDRFRLVLPPEGEADAMVRLVEAESFALTSLLRHEEALALNQYCLKTRLDHPTMFPNGGKVPFVCFISLGQSLMHVGRLDQAEAMLNKALAVLKSDGLAFHPSVVYSMHSLGQVYRQQGRKKDAADMAKKVKKLVPQVFPKDHPEYKKLMK
jgi:tetratricopeptide (TPR) repeat protein